MTECDARTPTRLLVYKKLAEVNIWPGGNLQETPEQRRELLMCVHLPPDMPPGDRRPAILLFHGGGWRGRNFTMFSRHCDHFAGLGMVAIHADYAPGVQQGIADAADALSAARRNAPALGIDPRRIVLGGGSSGGHIAACTLTLPELADPAYPPPMGYVGFNPVMDLRASEKFTELAGGREQAARVSPALHVDGRFPPALLIYGSRDRFLEGGQAFADRARATGVRCELDIHQDAEHGFFNQDPWFGQTLRRAEEFLASLGVI
jgi:acetyl esterase/lipase